VAAAPFAEGWFGTDVGADVVGATAAVGFWLWQVVTGTAVETADGPLILILIYCSGGVACSYSVPALRMVQSFFWRKPVLHF